jgi:integrase
MADVPAQSVETPVLTRPEWEKLLAAADRSATPYRDRALLHLFWHFGPSTRQVLELEVGHVNFLTGRLRWPGGPETPLPADALHALTSYVSFERDPRGRKLFTGKRGRGLNAVQLDRFFRRMREVSGVAVTPRSLRLAALYRLLEAHPLRAMAAVLRRRYAGAKPSHGR